VASVISERQEHGPFRDIHDFFDRVDATVCNKRLLESLIKAGAFDSLGHTRKSLLAVHTDLVDGALETKRAASIGQFDLFASPDGGSNAAAIVLPDDGEWEKSLLLAYEREMLGWFVSDHPLSGLDNVLARAADTSIAALTERQAGSIVSLAGMISGVQRKTTRQGAAWATVTLEDLSGSVEIMVFPQTYQKMAGYIIEDSVVQFRVRVDERDESQRLSAVDISGLDIDAGFRGPVVVNLDVARCAPALMDSLRGILAVHPGTVDVLVHLHNGERVTVVKVDDTLRVSPTSALFGDIKALLGPTALAVGI
jgi:DNA polymerase-3 subunit alpha